MSRECQVTGKRRLVGHKVSHSNIKTKKVQEVNALAKRYYLPELKQWVRLRISPSGIKTLTKIGGLSPFLLKTPLEALNPALRPWKRSLTKRLKIACR